MVSRVAPVSTPAPASVPEPNEFGEYWTVQAANTDRGSSTLYDHMRGAPASVASQNDLSVFVVSGRGCTRHANMSAALASTPAPEEAQDALATIPGTTPTPEVVSKALAEIRDHNAVLTAKHHDLIDQRDRMLSILTYLNRNADTVAKIAELEAQNAGLLAKIESLTDAAWCGATDSR